MALCANCGTNNIEGTKFCVGCGSQLGQAPAPESWRESSDLGAPPAGANEPPRPQTEAGGYAPQIPPPPPSYPAHNQPQPTGYQQPGYQQQPGHQQALLGGSQPVHPAVAAAISFFFPGLGLVVVPGKAGLGVGIFVAYLVVMTILIFLVIGICLAPVANVLLAIHSWDEAAKASRGQFQPILFK